jgi:eukaryotic-like serine/threonine-protein kinase
MGRANLINTYIGEYRLVDFLGAGGMGEVYRGVHSKIGRVVAVKILTETATSPDFLERFINEARIQASLNHPNIVTLYDFLEYNGQPCIVMELVDGQTLTERIRACGCLSTAETLHIFTSLVEGLQYVHGKGIVHRDIKSNNIKIQPTGEVKLLDFGIAKADSSPQLTMTGSVIGTLQYLSPEQIRGGRADVRSDIWALGVLLHEMVTGTPPFDATTIGELCDKIARAAYTAPSVLNPGVPKSVEAIVARCLKKNPGDRYQNAGELLHDLRKIGKQPAASAQSRPPLHVAIEPEPLPATGNKSIWILLGAAVVALLLLVGLGFYVLWPSEDGSTQRNTRGRESVKPAASGGVTEQNGSGDLKTFRIDAVDGKADVFINGEFRGPTPCDYPAHLGDKIDLVLKREGYTDLHQEIYLEGKRVFTFTMNKGE